MVILTICWQTQLSSNCTCLPSGKQMLDITQYKSSICPCHFFCWKRTLVWSTEVCFDHHLTRNNSLVLIRWISIFLLILFFRFLYPIVNFSWSSCDIPRLTLYDIFISQLVRFARWCTNVFPQSKHLQITSKLLTQGITSHSTLLSEFGNISFQEYVSKGITHPVPYADLVYKLRRDKGAAKFISSASKIVKCLQSCQYECMNIERTIGLELGPFPVLYRSSMKLCTLTRQWGLFRALSNPPQRRQCPDPRHVWLLFWTP